VPDYTGEQLGDYQVLRRIGRGAMAEVYLAEQLSLGRQVALKILSSDLASDAAYVSRFQHEARSAAALVHANIVQVHEVGCADGAYFIAQEYVPGNNLGELVNKQGRLEPGLVLDILRQAASALHKAQEGGIVHRDIKPENLMLGRGGEVKVADFGLARVIAPGGAQLTQVGVTMGTPLYMSPEQIEGRPVDARSDLYSLGITAYHLLAGEPPFQGETPLAVAVQHLNSRPAPLADGNPELPLRLTRVIDKLIAKRPEDRYQSPGELLAELRSLAKQAAAEGWAEGPENWTAPEMLALRDHPRPATAELDTLMKQATSIAPRRSPWGARAALLAGMLLLGAVVGWAARPEPLLGSGRQEVAPKETVLGQIYHAKMVDTEAAWLAVRKRFPDLDIRQEMMADQGLARLYLREQRYPEAREVCLELLNKGGHSDPYVQRFAIAGLSVSLVAMGQTDEAREALAMSDLDMFDLQARTELEQLEPNLARMFNEAIERLDGE
jgi:serine/threonine-protein kinase